VVHPALKKIRLGLGIPSDSPTILSNSGIMCLPPFPCFDALRWDREHLVILLFDPAAAIGTELVAELILTAAGWCDYARRRPSEVAGIFNPARHRLNTTTTTANHHQPVTTPSTPTPKQPSLSTP